MRTRSIFLFLCSGLSFAASFPVLTYSTYLRDNFTPKAIATDSAGNIYMTGSASVDSSTSQTSVLIVKLNPQGTQYLYMRFLGGSVSDSASALAVDSAGNAYVVGVTSSPDFPITTGGNLATSASLNNQRSFVAKLDPNGNLVFSDILGGSAASSAQAVAVNATGQIVVSGMVNGGTGPAFPSTSGAYSIATTANHPYLLEIDSTGTKIIFSATGIGGSALAFDSSGNIYVAGTTYLLDYPTTPAAYQAAFPPIFECYSPSCFGTSPGPNQYVTKVDPTAAKLIYSTSVSGTGGTVNAGLTVDPAGNAYLTGYAAATYPYTVPQNPPPPIGPVPFTLPSLPFLTKVDVLGQTLLFSVPIGGTGVQLDAKGNVYVGGGVGSPTGNVIVASTLSALASVPTQCLPNILIKNSAYVSQLDATSGNVLGTQFIGGATLIPSTVALAGSTLWIAGATSDFNVPFTANTITIPNLEITPVAGAYLGAVDFSQPQPPAGAPQIGCIVDSADFAAVGPAARYQLLTVLGAGLGPAAGVSAPDDSTTSLAGVSVNFGNLPAILLYVSSTQINLAVPLVVFNQSSAPMQVSFNSISAPPRQVPLTYANPNVFLNSDRTAVALNADGSPNSATNPASLGSKVSVFVNGLTPDPEVTTAPLLLYSDFGWSIIGTAQANPFVTRIDLRVPTALVNDFGCFTQNSCEATFPVYEVYPASTDPQALSIGGWSFGGMVYVNR